MQGLDALDRSEARGLHGLLFDLDDTLLDHGRLSEPAYSALHRLRESELRLLAVTGRPSGWGEVLVRQWPIDGAVTENGAISLFRQGDRVRRFDPADGEERARRRRRVAEIVAELGSKFPQLSPADDVGHRLSDFTFDVGEHRRVSPEVVRGAIEFIRERGARSFASSVHLHVTLDGDDKASGAVRLLGKLWGVDPTIARWHYAFIGDSENDAACFAAFRTTLGVSNLRGRPSLPPRFITEEPRGAGFVQAAQKLVELRAAP